MSTNGRHGGEFNDNKLYRCEVCGAYHRLPVVLDNGTAYCSIKCFDEYKQVSVALADMSFNELMAKLDELTKEGDL